MMDEKTKDLIQLYIDSRLDEDKTEEIKRLVKSDAEAKSYYKGLIDAQKKIKRLEHKAAFAEFAERWPRRVRTEHERKMLRRRIIRVASSAAAVAVVAFAGIGMLRAGLLKNTQEMPAFEVAEDSMVMEAEEDTGAAAKSEMAPEAPMMEAAPAPEMLEEESTENADDTDAQAAEAAAGDRDVNLTLPENAFVIENSEGNAEDFFAALVVLTEGQDEQPVREENRVMIFLNQENYQTIFTFLSEKDIPAEPLEIGMTLVMIFTE